MLYLSIILVVMFSSEQCIVGSKEMATRAHSQYFPASSGIFGAFLIVARLRLLTTV